MRLKPLKFLPLLMLSMSLCAIVSLPGCGKKKEDSTTTDSKKEVLPRAGQPRLVAEDTPIKTYVKDSKGVRTKINDVARKGEYVMADLGPAPVPKAPVIDNTPPPAPVSLPPTK